MIIILKNTDIFNSSAQALVNPVNCVGVMGKGLALQFKMRDPDLYESYRIACQLEHIRIGYSYVYFSSKLQKYIINFPTKVHWKDSSQLEYIEQGMKDFVNRVIPEYNLKTIAFPKIGCGLGGLPWKEVKQIIIDHIQPLHSSDLKVYLLENND